MLKRVIAMVGLVLALAWFNRATAAPNPNTDWFKDARYGVFMHFLPADAQGLARVEQFDVDALAAQLESAGAKYFVLTLGQNSGYFNAPNAVYDRVTGYAEGQRCSQRDLPLDLHRALERKGIRLMLYLPCQPPNQDVQAQQAFGLRTGKQDQPIDLGFARKWADVIQEWSDRYGAKVSGWWFDGGYEHVHFNEAIAQTYALAVKHGNPKAIVTFNPGVKVIRYTNAEDYTAGELDQPFTHLPASRSLDGSQWHALTFLGSNWGRRDTRFPNEPWINWVKSVVANEGVVTLDMGPNYDPQAGPVGTLAPGQLSQVQAIGVALTQAYSASPAQPRSTPSAQGSPWDLSALSEAPAYTALERPKIDGVKAIRFVGPPFKGKPTQVFAWVGVPQVKAGEKVPAMVLIHGGGGTAFEEWVRLWVSRGYAAIAMDTCGQVPVGNYGRWLHDPDSGPPGWGGLDQLQWPREDQWTYHAVADAILAHSLIRSLPEVDSERTGVTGISWGGYLTCIVAGVDSRFKLAVPVYGCGFYRQTSFAGELRKLGAHDAERWMKWWDPSEYLGEATMPILWVTGSNDFAYTLDALQPSYRLAKGPRALCIRLRMPHAHGGAGENPEEIRVFADSILMGKTPLPAITGAGRDRLQVWATADSKVKIVKAELNYTTDTGRWQERTWESIPAIQEGNRFSAQLPEDSSTFYFNLFDDRDCVVSTEHEALKINHAFLATGAETRIVSGSGEVTWRSPLPTRDGWVLENDHVLLAVSKCAEFPNGGVTELTRDGETVFKWQGTQAEVNTAQALPDDKYLVTEAGPKPRLLEIDRQGKILVEVPIQCQLTNFHMQTRMSRKLTNGNYLVPHLLDKVVREYSPQGKVVWEAATPHWAFTAIRLTNGNTLVGCTYGNQVVEFDAKGKIVWSVTNDDLEGRPLKDACGVQRLPNGNTVITSYGAKPSEVRLTEVTSDRKIVWTYTDDRPSSIHEFQILDANGKRLPGPPLR